MRVTSRGRSREHRVLPVTCSVTRSFLPSPRRLPSLLSTNGCIPSSARLSTVSLSRRHLFTYPTLPLLLVRSRSPPVRREFVLSSSIRNEVLETGHEDTAPSVMIALVLARFDDMFVPAPPWRLRASLIVHVHTRDCHPGRYVRCNRQIKF